MIEISEYHCYSFYDFYINKYKIKDLQKTNIIFIFFIKLVY
jgi:hypothetical protein